MTKRILPGLLILAWAAPAQRLYNADQDKRAQEALKAGQDLSPSAGFDSALENLREIWKLRQEQVFRSAHTLMRADLGSWITWGNLKESVNKISADLNSLLATGNPADLKAQLDAAAKARESARAQLAEVAKSVSESPAAGVASAGTWLERVGQIDPVVSYLNDLTKDGSSSAAQVAAAAEAVGALKKLADLYSNFTLDLPKNPHALLLEYQLQVLSLEVQHVNEQIRIRERLDHELQVTREVLGPVQTALRVLNLPNEERITTRLEEAAGRKDPKELRELTFLLYNAAALAARGNTPVRLAEMRSTMEDRAHSLRLAGGSAAFHQQLIVNGLQRLALYYQGGLKASTIAELVQALATVGIVPAVWTK